MSGSGGHEYHPFTCTIYPIRTSIEYLFGEILRQVPDYGSIYIGVTSADVDAARRAGEEYLRLTTSDPATL